MGLLDKNKGWDYLFSDDQDEKSYYDDDGNWGYRNDDGSSSYYGADGSWGYRNSDGSGSYYGSDGSWGYINSDGNSSYFESDKSEENEDESYDEECENDTNISTMGDGIAALLGFAIGFGVPAYFAYKNIKNEEERKEEEKRIEKEHIRKEKQKIKQKQRKIRNKRLKAFLFNKKNIKTNVSSDTLVGNNVQYVTERIKEAGFTNCETVPIKDIHKESDKKIGEVEQIVINGQSCFDANTMFPYTAQIIISYHTKCEIAFPVSSKQICKMKYENLMNELYECGYTEIYTEKLSDLVTGWIHKDGSVKRVLVNGKAKYKKGERFDYDAKIVIIYHTFAKER